MFYSFHYVKGYHVNIALERFKSSNFSFPFFRMRKMRSPLFIKSFLFPLRAATKRFLVDKILLKAAENSELH